MTHSTYVGPSLTNTKEHLLPHLAPDQEIAFVHSVPREPSDCDIKFEISLDLDRRGFSVMRLDHCSGWTTHLVFDFLTQPLVPRLQHPAGRLAWRFLPNVLLSLIFSYLKPQELFRRIRPVCSQWRRTTVAWSRLVLPETVGGATLALDSCHIDQLRSIEVRSEHLELCLDKAPETQALTVKGQITNQTLNSLFKATNLCELTLQEISDPNRQRWRDPQLDFRSLNMFSQVTTLRLQKVSIDEDQACFLAQAPLLQYLQLCLSSDSPIGNFDFLRPLRELRGLDLTCSSGIKDTSIKLLVEVCPKLEDLRFQNSHDFIEDNIYELSRLTSLTRLHLSCDDSLSDWGLQHLKNLTMLNHLTLRLWNTLVTSAGFLFLAHLKLLSKLELCWEKMGSEDLGFIAQHDLNLNLTCLKLGQVKPSTTSQWTKLARFEALEKLEVFPASPWNMSDDEVISLLPRLQRLNSLHLPLVELTDRGLVSVCYLPVLQELQLTSCSITNQSLKLLASIPSLKSLTVWFCRKLSDQAWAGLAESKSLRVLDIAGCEITDTGLHALSWLTALTHLSLASCAKITKAGLRYLRGLEHVELNGIEGNKN